MYIFLICPQVGIVNEIEVSVGSIASRMMETFEDNGFKWVDYVDGNIEMAYTLERRK